MAFSNNYVLGRGRVYFDRFAQGTKVSETGELYIGNTPEFNTSSSSETLDHYSSEGGLKVKDESVTLQINRTGSFMSDNISLDNLALFFTGTKSTVTTASATATTETLTLVKDRYFQIGKTAANPAGLRKITNFVLKTTGGSPVTVAAAGNYEIDLTLGRLYVLPNAAAILDGTQYTLTYDVTASTHDRVISKNTPIYGAVRFVADNAVGANRDFYLPYVKLSPNGDYNLKGDDWQQIGFEMEILKLDDATESIYIDGRPA